jgi:hypothetical protein
VEVYIDGVRYVPASTVLANRDDLLRALIGLFWGSTSSKDEAWCAEEARTLYVQVVEQHEGSAPTLSAFLDQFAASLAAGTAE